MKLHRIIFFALFFFCYHSFAAQHLDKMWSLLTLSGNYGPVVYNIEPQLRLVDQPKVFQQFLNNSGLGYQIANEWQIWLGQTFSADAQDAVSGSADEYRLWEQVVWQRRFSNTQVISRTRLEERKSLYFNPWAIRVRERFLINQPIRSNLSLVLMDEMFFNLNRVPWIITQTFDQNRVFIGIEQKLSPVSYIAIGYMNQYLSLSNRQYNNVLYINFRIDLTQS